MKKRVTVVGAAAIGDYIFHVDQLPVPGQIVKVRDGGADFIPGGCAPNIAMGMAALNRVQPTLCYPVGDDTESNRIVSQWINCGIECELTHVLGNESGKSWMFMQDDGTTMCFAYPGAADSATAIPGGLEDWVVICPVFNQFTKAYADEAVSQKKHLVFTGIAVPELIGYLPNSDVVIINQFECRTLCEAISICSAAELSKLYPCLRLYVTNGSKGSSLFRQGVETKIPLVSAECILDFTGAGDAYTSGVVSALMQDAPAEFAGLIGAANVSFVIENFGGQNVFPSWEDILDRLKQQHILNT